MKTKTLYQIRSFQNSASYSVGMSQKLRTRTSATRLVKYLKARGFSAFAAPVKVAA